VALILIFDGLPDSLPSIHTPILNLLRIEACFLGKFFFALLVKVRVLDVVDEPFPQYLLLF
jgi:hypothetical protein